MATESARRSLSVPSLWRAASRQGREVQGWVWLSGLLNRVDLWAAGPGLAAVGQASRMGRIPRDLRLYEGQLVIMCLSPGERGCYLRFFWVGDDVRSRCMIKRPPCRDLALSIRLGLVAEFARSPGNGIFGRLADRVPMKCPGSLLPEPAGQRLNPIFGRHGWLGGAVPVVVPRAHGTAFVRCPE